MKGNSKKYNREDIRHLVDEIIQLERKVVEKFENN